MIDRLLDAGQEVKRYNLLCAVLQPIVRMGIIEHFKSVRARFSLKQNA